MICSSNNLQFCDLELRLTCLTKFPSLFLFFCGEGQTRHTPASETHSDSIYGYRPLHPAYSPSSLPCCAVNSHPVSFLYSRGCNHPVPSRRVSVRNYTKCLRRAGYVVQAYHPAPLGAADPIKGCTLCCCNVRYFLPPNNDTDYLVKTLRNQTRASWFKPPR